MEFLHPLAQAYSEKYSTAPSPQLAELARLTNEAHPRAHMMSGPVQGALLEMISLMLQPRRVLEIGSFTGYSALCMARGLPKDGKLHTIELREADAATANEFFKLSIWKDQIILHLGNALEIIPGLNEPWDLVFIDADKTGYIDYYEQVLPQMRPGAWMLADNVLFHGDVLEETVKGKNAKAIQAFNDHVLNDDRVEQVLLTIRDGLMLIRKK